MEKKKKKLIDLTILEHFLDSGVSAIALVEEPAIEIDFFAFKEEKMEEMEVVVNTPPYVEQNGKKKKKNQYFDEELMLAFFAEAGIGHEDFIKKYDFADASAIPSVDIIDDETAAGKTFYIYDGDPPQRDFCQQMMSMGRYYTYDEINLAGQLPVNSGFGPQGTDTYDIWTYKGGPNCHHFWRKLYVSPKGIVNKGPAVGNAGEKTKNLPNSGYLMHGQFAEVKEGDQQILVGPAMIPMIEIPRKDEKGEIFYVQFSQEAVAKIMEKFMKEQTTWSTNQDHESDKPADTYIFESWIVEDSKTDKANTVYGFNVPVGTWMVKMRVNNPEVWARVKAGELRGFSVEGNFISQQEIDKVKEEGQLLKKIIEIVS